MFIAWFELIRVIIIFRMRQSGIIPKYSASETAEVLFIGFSTFTKEELVPPLQYRKSGRLPKSPKPGSMTSTG